MPDPAEWRPGFPEADPALVTLRVTIVDWHASAGGFCDMRSRAIHDLLRRTSEFRREPRATTSFGPTVGNNDAAVFNDRKVRAS